MSKDFGQKTLVYAQDAGGAQFIVPIIKEIQKEIPLFVVVHPLAEAIFKKYNISFYPLSHFFKNIPVEQKDIELFLKDNNISNIFCTTSSLYRDATNSLLIETARNLSIPTFGVLDHWKGYDRFFDKDNAAKYLPDFIGCIDEFCKQELIKLYKEENRIFILGHPHLEEALAKEAVMPAEKKEINIAIISQPNPKESFRSIFLNKTGSTTVIDEIIAAINKIKIPAKIKLKFRPHPKEPANQVLPEGLSIDKTGDALENDIFIGLDSMLLVEAYLRKKHCLSLNIPELSASSDKAIPYLIGERINSLADMDSVLSAIIKKVEQGVSPDTSAIEQVVKGSCARTKTYFKQFVNGDLVFSRK